MGIVKIERVSSFCTHKRGETNDDIQDCIGIDEANQRFALSDGVTNSVLPKLWAKLLVEDYLSIEQIDSFPSLFLPQLFEEQKEQVKKTLTEDQLFLTELAEEEFVTSAATFVGISIIDDEVLWKIIGDSCLFLVPRKGPVHCINSLGSYEDENHKISMGFNNRPNVLRSDGSIRGEWFCGRSKLESGFILLMSDKMSNWFIDQYNNGDNPINTLLSIDDNNLFELFVEKEYSAKRLKSDDESVILLQISCEKSNNTAEETVISEKYSDANLFSRVISSCRRRICAFLHLKKK